MKQSCSHGNVFGADFEKHALPPFREYVRFVQVPRKGVDRQAPPIPSRIYNAAQKMIESAERVMDIPRGVPAA